MTNKYSALQICLHWSALVIVAITYAAMELRGVTESGTAGRFWFVSTHYSFGFLMLILMTGRLLVRFQRHAPPITPAPAKWMTAASHATHGIIYAMFLALPLLGMLTLYLKGQPWVIFAVPMPVAATPDGALSHNIKNIHEFIANAGYFIIGLHAAAALFHHFILRDNTLLRMMPGKKPS
ncbi:cytochrome b561 [Pantoea sp. B65]|uniref:cytochrome b561 n=1 Tax=Pantoea sp. B65 TaxID=2813359 RepID=UPI0039B5ACF8